MRKIFWTLFCLIELTLPVFGGNLPGDISPEIPSRPTVADGPQLSVNVTTGICNPATNQYTLSGTISLINAVAGTLTVKDGSVTTTVNVTAGQTSASFSLAGLQAGSGNHTVTVSGAGYNPTSTPSGSFAIIGATNVSCTPLSPTQRQIKFTPQYSGLNGSAITFAVAGELAATTTQGPYTLNLYNDNPTITLNALQSNVQSTFRYNWLDACNNSSSGYSASTSYNAPASCTSTTAQLSLTKQVDKSRAAIGDVLTYTLLVTNKSTGTLNNVVVRDSMSTGLTYQANSATPPAGTVFTKGPLTTSTWTVNSLAAGQTISLTLQAKVDSSGVLYDVATAPGVVAKACTSIPIKVCTGDTYIFRLILEPGRTNYKWFRNDVEIAGQNTNTLDVTTPGAYRMSSDNSASTCTEYSCCPFIIEEEGVPTFQASAQTATCSGNNPQNNASITLAGFNSAHTFQYSAGTSFNPAASLSGAARTIPANGVLVSNLANPNSAQSYTVRVYNGGGCYTDATVQLQPATCSPSGSRLVLSVVAPGSCSPATNQYTLTGTISLTNAVAGTLTIADGSASTTINVTAGQSSASFSLPGLPAGSGNHTFTVSGAGYSTASATYNAPASCSGTTPPTPNTPILALSVAPGSCSPTTNQYTLTGTISLTNAVAGTLTIADGSASTTINVTAGQSSASFSLPGLPAGSGNHTVTASGAGYNPTSTTTTSGTFAIAGINTITCTTLSPTQRRVNFTPQYSGVDGSSITFAMVGQIAPTTTAGPYTLSLYTDNPAIAVTARQGSVQSSFTYRWLEACNNGGSGTTSVAASANYSAPASCLTTPGGPQLTLVKQVDKSRAAIGDVLTYTLLLTNNSSNTLNNVIVRDSMSTGLTYQANSATPPAGTVFTKGPSTTSTWTVNSLAAGQTLSLTLRARVDSSGILYNLATTTGATAKTCTSVPIKVCAGTTYGFRITAESGQTNYKWFRNDVEIAGQNTNTLDVTTPGAYRMSSDNSASTCTAYSCCPFIIEEEGLPTFQASAQTATCSDNNPQNNASITLAGFNSAHTFQYSAGTSFNPAASLSGAARTIPANGVLVSNLANPASAQSYTIRVYNGGGCYTDATVQLQPATCSSSGARLVLSTVTPGNCSPANNQYTLTGTISLTNAVAGTLTIADGSANTTVNVTAGQTSASFTLAGLTAGSGNHTVTASGAGYNPTSTTTTSGTFAIAGINTIACTTLSPTQRWVSFTPQYSGVDGSPITFAMVGQIAPTTTAGPYTLSLYTDNPAIAVTARQGSVQSSFTYRWLEACNNGGSGTTTTYAASANYSAPASCSGTTMPTPPILALSVTPGICSPTNNQYTLTGTISLTNAIAGTLTIADGSINTTVNVTAGQSSATFSLPGLPAGSGNHNVTVSGAGYSTASASYNAPASCSGTTPPNTPILALSVSAGVCSPANNQYTLTGTISLTNAVAGTLTIADGSASTTINVTAGQSSASFSLPGLPAGSGNHTVTVSGAGYNPTSTTTTTSGTFAIAGINTITCTTLSPTQRRVNFTPQYSGVDGSPITFAMVGQIAATTTAGPYTLSLYTDNPAIAVTARQGSVQSSFTYRWLEACNNGGSGTTTTYAASANYSAPASCSGTTMPTPPILALSVAPGSCSPATNQYTLTGTISLTNAVAGTLTIADGSASTTINVTAGQSSASFSLPGLPAGSGNHTFTVSGAGYSTASATYNAPASCSGTTPPTPNTPILALSVAPGSCSPATNQYTLTGTISLTNAVAGTLTIADGSTNTTINVVAGQTSATFSLPGLPAGSGNHTVTVSGAGYNPTSTTTSGTFAIAGINTITCTTLSPTQRRVSFTPQYSGVDGSPITFSIGGQIAATTTAGPYTLSLYTDNPAIAVTARQGSVQSSFTYRWLEACNTGGSGTTTYAASANYTAPASCSVTPVTPPTLALNVEAGRCNPTTNQYELAGTITLTNAVAGSLLVTDGAINKVLPITAGQTTASFILPGLTSGSGSHTVIVSEIGYPSTPPTSPAHIAIVGVTTVNCLTLSAGIRQVLFIPQYGGLSNEPVSFSVVNELVPTTNPGPYSLTLYIDNPMITLYAQQGGSSDSFRYNWLQACSTNPGSVTNGAGYTPVLATYEAPASCTVSAPASGPSPTSATLALRVKPETCDPATNQYKLTGIINLTNAVAGSLLVTDGNTSTILNVTDGQTTANFSLMGLASGSGIRMVTVSESVSIPANSNDADPFTIAGATTISCLPISATQRQVIVAPQYTGVNGSPIRFSVTNELSPTTVAGPYVLNLFIDNPVVTLNAQQDQKESTFLYKWLEACTNSNPVSVAYAPASTTYTAPDACFATPQISLAVTPETGVAKSPNGRVAASPGLPLKLVDKSRAIIGDILTYTLVLTNSGNTDLIDAVVRDSASVGLTYVPNSATAPAGTIFTPGTRVSTWTVGRLAPNERLSLVFKAKVDSTGILYNTATVQGDTAIVCTSVPVKVCPGSVYSFTLVAKQGRTTYRWFRDGREIPGQMNHILVVTAPGSYSLDPSGGAGLCPDFSCCPFIVEFDTLPSFRAMTVPVTCTGTTPQANGKLVISEFGPSFTYQYSAGTQFNPAASLSGGAQLIPTDGVLANNLANPVSSQPYTVRVYNNSGCYRDVTTMLSPTGCGCLPDACVPFVIKKNGRAR